MARRACSMVPAKKSASTPEADTSTWDNLPQFISFAAMELPVGTHSVTIDFLDSTGRAQENLTKAVTVNVRETNRDTVIFISDCSTTPQNQ